MNKKLLLIWTFLLFFVMGMSAAEKSAVIKFKDTGTASDNKNSTTEQANLIAEGSELIKSFSASGKLYQAQTGYGIKFGNSNSGGNITITLVNTYKPSKIIANVAGYSTSENSFTINGTELTELSKKPSFIDKEIAYDGNTEVNEIAISTKKRGYITSVTIVYDDENGIVTSACATPTIAGTTPFVGSTTVTLACETADAKIYYTLNGDEPTAESTAYAEPFTIEATTTVKAIAIKGADKSSVATKEFVATPIVANVAALNALEDKSIFSFGGETTVVANPESRYLYLKDETGYTLVYGAPETADLEVGQHIAANWTGSVNVYNKLFEAVPSSSLTAVADVKDEVVYDELTPADIKAENMNKVGVLKNVAYYVIKPTDGKAKDSYEFETEDGTIVKGYDQFSKNLEYATPGDVFDVVGAIGVYGDNVQFWPISVTRIPQVQDIEGTAQNGSDLSVVVSMLKDDIVEAGDKVGSIYLTLASGGEFKITQPIEANGSVLIMTDGEEPATIDASALEGAFIQMGEPSVDADANGFFPIDNVLISNVNIKGLNAQLFYANKQKVLIDQLNFISSVAHVNGGSKTIFDTNGGGVIGTLNIQNSTIYANPQNTGALYSSQSGQKATEAGLETQTIAIQNSTLYNIAYNKNVNSHRQANQKWLAYILKNSLILDCGKEGQFVKGLNQGQSGTNPVWDIDNNSFLRTVDGNIVDQSAMETTGDADEPVKNSVADYTTFKDLANGDFTIEAGSLQAKMKVGDPRWLVEYDATMAHPINIVLNPETDTDLAVALNEAKQNVDKIGSITINLAADAKYTVSAPLEAVGEFSLTGVKENPATIDASANNGAFLQMSATPDEATLGTGEFYHVKGYVNISNVNIDNVKGQLVYDNNVKYCVENLTIDNCKVSLASDEATGINGNAVVYFKGGFANTLSVSNSTFWNTGASDAKYFVQYNNGGRADRAGYEYSFVIFQNNTFHNVAVKGQWANYSGFAGQKCSSFIVTDNIFSNCGNEQIARRILGGRNASSYAEGMVTFKNNTYMTKAVSDDNTETTTFENVATYDESGTVIEMDPMFKDAANADFTLGASTKQAKLKTGDPRWLVDFVAEDVTNAKAALLAEIQKATQLLGDADTETDEAAKALKDAIDKAQNTYDNSEFNSELEKALEELKAAEDAYNTSAISNVNSDNVNAGAWYTLQGVKVEKPVKGNIYLHNGKKVVLK